MYLTHKVTIVAAMDKNRGIGLNNSLPWPSIPEDIAFLKNITKDKLCVVGRKTFESLPKSFKKDRRFWVLTSSETFENIPGVTYSSLEEFDPLEDFFVLGGSQIYKLFLEYTDEAYMTHIHNEYKVDSYMPNFENESFSKENIRDEKTFCITRYRRYLS